MLFATVKEIFEAIFTLENPWKTVCLAVGTLYLAKKGSAILIRHLGRKYLHEPVKQDFQQNVVYLFAFPKSYTKQCPNLSPFVLKVETWLKLKEINYEVVETTKFSSDTKQLPYIYYNGTYVSDSNRIIDHLTKCLHFDPTEGLTPEQRGISRALQRMVDEGTSWTYLIDRYVYRPELFSKVFRPRGNQRYIREKIRSGLATMYQTKARYQGTGRLEPEVVAAIGKDDFRAVSQYLGDKKFLMGDNITKVDCAVFGHFSLIAFVDFPFAHKELLNKECINLRHYLYRVREQLWPDWFQRSPAGEFTD